MHRSDVYETRAEHLAAEAAALKLPPQAAASKSHFLSGTLITKEGVPCHADTKNSRTRR